MTSPRRRDTSNLSPTTSPIFSPPLSLSPITSPTPSSSSGSSFNPRNNNKRRVSDFFLRSLANSGTSTSVGGMGFTTTPQSFAESDSPTTSGSSSPELSMKRPGGLTDGPNARSKSITVADGSDTFGVLNRHPAPSQKKSNLSSSSPTTAKEASSTPYNGSFRVGVSEDRNKRCRKSMEDAHSFVYDFAAIKGQGYFAVFDGHAGKHAAEWCGLHFHEYFLDALVTSPDQSVPDLLNKTFHIVDSQLSQLSQTFKSQSGCTAVTAFLRLEKPAEDEPRGFTNPNIPKRGLIDGSPIEDSATEDSSGVAARKDSAASTTSIPGSSGEGGSGAATPNASNSGAAVGRRGSAKKLGNFLKGLTGGSSHKDDSSTASQAGDEATPEAELQVEAIDAKGEGLRKVLYTANVGDARAVLCRGGKAVRLTYDHKGSDSLEVKRITDAGGFVMNNRVNGVLAVTRSLGDASMKEFVVGSPYTTETTLDEQDEFLIVACDGLWDVTEDQGAVDIIRDVQDPQEASEKLLHHAITNYSTDNLSVMVIRFYH